MPIRRLFLRLTALAVALALSACVHYTQIGPGDYAVHDKLSVTLGTAWNRQTDGPGMIWPESWTKNGPLLDTLVLAPAIEDGKALLTIPSYAMRDIPRYRAGSAPADIVEFVQATLTKAKIGGDFETIAIEPAKIAGQDGIRFEFRFGGGEAGGIETDRHALGYAFEREKQLYLILFHAAEIHYFPSLRPTVEAIVASARLPGARTAASR